MNFYRSNNSRKFIATDSKMSIIITKSESESTVSALMVPYFKKDNEIYEESSFAEFFNEYDKIFAFINAVANITRNG